MNIRFKQLAQLSVYFVLITLAACSSSDTKVSALFKNTTDIEDGESVYMAEKVVGKVVDVDKVDAGTKVILEIDPDQLAAVRGSAALVKNRLKANAPLEIYNRENDSSELVDGQTITGLDSMFQLGAWMVGDVIKLGGASIGQYVDAFTKYLDSEQFQSDKAQVKSQIDQTAKEMSDAVGTVGQQVDQAMKDLAAAEGPATEAVKQLGEELSPVVEELAGSGAAIIQQIEALTQSLSESGGEEQQAGENFLATLVETLEKLNQSIETGVTQGVDQTEVDAGEEAVAPQESEIPKGN